MLDLVVPHILSFPTATARVCACGTGEPLSTWHLAMNSEWQLVRERTCTVRQLDRSAGETGTQIVKQSTYIHPKADGKGGLASFPGARS